jgi:hypothetical protein|tara:strand:+ start:349 stop:771 length:423 start_codon:yes stop_codon:yes gene_type:complete
MSIYSDKQQSRVAVNPKTGESKVFKSTGVDAKGKHFFTSMDNAKIRNFITGEKPTAKTGLPVGRTSSGEMGALNPRTFGPPIKIGGPNLQSLDQVQEIQERMLIDKNRIKKEMFDKMKKRGPKEFRNGGRVNISNFKGQF